MAKWTDVTSYSRSDTERTPKTWELQLGSELRICVSRSINYSPNEWVMSARGVLDISQRVLKSKNITEAQAEALDYVRSAAASVLRSLDAVKS